METLTKMLSPTHQYTNKYRILTIIHALRDMKGIHPCINVRSSA